MVNYEETIRQFAEGDKDYELWLLLTRARYAVYRARERELQRYGLTPEQAQVLAILHYSEEKVSPGSLAQLVLLKPHTMSALINRMEKKGLVKKVNDLERKNMVRVTLTEKGKKAHEITSKRSPIHHVMSVLSEEESEQFHQTLNKILNKAGEELGLNRDPLPSSE
jgi:DNA-binding MarR family transcriptional regulator